MALKFFRFTSLPTPPDKYDSNYFRNFIRQLELYFNQWDSNTPNYADSYTANYMLTTNMVVADLPSASTVGAGARCFVTDATATTFNNVVAGGGANKVPVFSDGTNWRIG